MELQVITEVAEVVVELLLQDQIQQIMVEMEVQEQLLQLMEHQQPEVAEVVGVMMDLTLALEALEVEVLEAVVHLVMLEQGQ